MPRSILSEAQIHSAVRGKVAAHGADIVKEVQDAVAGNEIVVVGMRQNPFPKKARKLLDAAGLAYKYLEYGSYFGAWRRRNALKMWTGWPTFPMVFVKGTLVGGADDLTKLAQPPLVVDDPSRSVRDPRKPPGAALHLGGDLAHQLLPRHVKAQAHVVDRHDPRPPRACALVAQRLEPAHAHEQERLKERVRLQQRVHRGARPDEDVLRATDTQVGAPPSAARVPQG